jgi:hypothetical protein
MSYLFVSTNVLPSPADADDNEKAALELYKLEYERGTQRYDDIYKAAWTNFSYMALVAGAILTFGGDRFLPELSAFLACLPLLFWWLASFEPLNKYGDQVIDRLGLIELLITDKGKLGELSEEEQAAVRQHKGLRHYRYFSTRIRDNPIKDVNFGRWIAALLILAGLLIFALREFKVTEYNSQAGAALMIGIAGVIVWLLCEIWYFNAGEKRENPKLNKGHFFRTRAAGFRRVRFVVRVFASLLLIVAICLSARVYQVAHKGDPLLIRKSPEVKVIPVDFKNNLGVKLDGITAKEAQELLQKNEEATRKNGVGAAAPANSTQQK